MSTAFVLTEREIDRVARSQLNAGIRSTLRQGGGSRVWQAETGARHNMVVTDISQSDRLIFTIRLASSCLGPCRLALLHPIGASALWLWLAWSPGVRFASVCADLVNSFDCLQLFGYP